MFTDSGRKTLALSLGVAQMVMPCLEYAGTVDIALQRTQTPAERSGGKGTLLTTAVFLRQEAFVPECGDVEAARR